MRLLGCLLALLLALLLAGCSSGEEPTPATTAHRFTDAPIFEGDLRGRLYLPEDPVTGPAVVVLGGTEGGTPTHVAEEFARAGHTTLALAYFGEPGMPTARQTVALEYFPDALRWLPEQPGVDDRPPVLWGASRGAEAALQVASRWPDLVSGVVAASPADTSVCRTSRGKLVVEWSFRDEPVPCVRFMGGYSGYEDAAIRVERMTSPLLLTCGEQDPLGPACLMARRIVDRLDESGTPIERALHAYEGAGHFVAIPPGLEIGSEQQVDDAVNLHAREDAWDQTLRFLREVAAD